MASINVDLVFNGNCNEAFDFYKSVFGGEYSYFGKYKEMPSKDHKKFAAQDDISLQISKETCLMGHDYIEGFGNKIIFGNNFSLSIDTESKEEADKLFGALSEGGKVTMPMENTFWNAYFGLFSDKFGINWMVSFEKTK